MEGEAVELYSALSSACSQNCLFVAAASTFNMQAEEAIWTISNWSTLMWLLTDNLLNMSHLQCLYPLPYSYYLIGEVYCSAQAKSFSDWFFFLEAIPTTKGDCFSDLKTPLLRSNPNYPFIFQCPTYIEGKGASSRRDQRNPPLKLGVQRAPCFVTITQK